jgi:hypothetical protein
VNAGVSVKILEVWLLKMQTMLQITML